MTDTAIHIAGLTKAFKIYTSPLRRVTDAITRRKSYKEFVALKDITVDLPKGEVIGILGKNGSGKSTLLKIITGVTQQTAGEVRANGRIAAMLELTAGFDPELTGIENIYLKALSLGIPKHEIAKRMDSIIAFADIGDHINDPVRTYSSGMKSRLGFAVSVNVDPDILVVDEVLAVGDDIFKLKCIEKMKEFRQMGKTILFVSHSLFTVKAFCTKGMWLNGGRLMEYGDLGPVMLKYEDYLKAEKAKLSKAAREETGKDAVLTKTDILQTSQFSFFHESGETNSSFAFGEDVCFSFSYTVKRNIDNLNFGFTVRDAEKNLVYMSSKRDSGNRLSGTVGTHTLRVRLKVRGLLEGTYLLSGELWDNDSTFYVGFSNKRTFRIIQEDYKGSGIVYIEHEFTND